MQTRERDVTMRQKQLLTDEAEKMSSHGNR